MLLTAMTMEGMISEPEAAVLHRLAREATGAIVEIGSYRGRSTIALALGSRAGAGVPVYAIDPHEAFTEPGGFQFGRMDARAFVDNLTAAGVLEDVRIVQLPAAAVVFDEPIGLLWIDGEHNQAQRDFEQFAPSIPAGGRVVFHDSYLDAVQDAITCAQLAGLRIAETCDCMVIMERE